jgi:NADH-quinone oxidoreductase subunit M
MIASLSSMGLPGLNGFVGEFLILLGSFKSPILNNWWFTVIAASGVIFAAVYLLWMYQRVIFGEVKNPKMNSLTDMNKREIFILSSIFIFIIWIGVYPSTFLNVSAKSTQNVIQQVTGGVHAELPSGQIMPVKATALEGQNTSGK